MAPLRRCATLCVLDLVSPLRMCGGKLDAAKRHAGLRRRCRTRVAVSATIHLCRLLQVRRIGVISDLLPRLLAQRDHRRDSCNKRSAENAPTQRRPEDNSLPCSGTRSYCQRPAATVSLCATCHHYSWLSVGPGRSASVTQLLINTNHFQSILGPDGSGGYAASERSGVRAIVATYAVGGAGSEV